MTKFKLILLTGTAIIFTGCSDDNAAPVYGKDNGLPLNCRAFVQFAIDEHRAGKYSANDTLSALERNCGANGWSWKNKR